MKRFLNLTIAATAAVLCMASPALAHEEISPSTFPTGKPTFFTLSAANEKTVDLTSIAVAAPAGLPFGATTHQPAGWTPDKSPTRIAWTGGKVAPDNFEQWGFEIEGADQPGALRYKVTMGFADGSSDDVDVDVTAVAPAGGGGPEPATTSPGAATTAVTPSTTASAAPTSDSSDDGLAVAALVVAVAGALVAGVALVISLRGRRAGAPAAGQDW